MKLIIVCTKMFHQVLLIGTVIILLTDVAISLHPQPGMQTEKSELTKPQLPPKIFPKENANDSIPHHMQGEIPPLHFPYETTLSNSKDDLTTIGSSKIDLNKKDANKDKEQDDKGTASSNKALIDNKPAKVASEVPDLLKSNMNITVYDDGTENPLNNETDTVQGPNVINVNKTHEENTNSTIETKSKTVNKTTEENQTNEKNVSTMLSPPKNTTSDDPKDEKNATSTISPVMTTNDTDIDDKQNSTQISSTTEQDTGNVTEVSTHNGNETDTLETKSPENETSTFEYNSTVPITDKTTVTPISKIDSTVEPGTVDEKNVTTTNYTNSNDTTIGVSSTTVVPSMKAESTTANISENLIDHTPAALQHGDHSHATSGKSSAFLQPTESAAILAGIFVGIALVGYVGLLIWRRILEKRYGNREMLVNEDDFYDTNDLRNFEL